MCLFCSIAKHEIEANIVFENENIIAFLDISPINEGHVLVVPKTHFLDADEIPNELLYEIMYISKKSYLQLKKFINLMVIQSCRMVENLMISGTIICIFFPDMITMVSVGLSLEKNRKQA